MASLSVGVLTCAIGSDGLNVVGRTVNQRDLLYNTYQVADASDLTKVPVFLKHHRDFFPGTLKVKKKNPTKNFLGPLRYLLRVALDKTLNRKAHNPSKSIQLNEIHSTNPSADGPIFIGPWESWGLTRQCLSYIHSFNPTRLKLQNRDGGPLVTDDVLNNNTFLGRGFCEQGESMGREAAL